MSKQLRKVERNPDGRLQAIQKWATRHFLVKYGERAVAMAAVCRQNGLRDLVVKVSDIAECIPAVASRMRVKPSCMVGGWNQPGKRCNEEAVILTITDSGQESFFCQEHAEERVVRLPT